MANKKSNSKNTSLKLTPIEKMLKSKADSLIKAEKEFWKYRYKIEDQQKINADIFELNVIQTIPEDLSSTVWALRDGVVFVRYQSFSKKRMVDFKSMNTTIKEWNNNCLIVPTTKGEISLAKSGVIQASGNIKLYNCSINDIHIPYVEFAHAYYENDDLPSPIERAIIDFQLSFLGVQLNDKKNEKMQSSVNSDQTISKLKSIYFAFEDLLNDSKREEELQVFIKEHPLLLHPTAELIPKKRLGEDFITDFVLVIPSDQGPTYILVEIEKASFAIITKDYSLSSYTNHAIKQTKDWDVWLEKNKAYFQSKLPGFETPKYIVVIGRGVGLDENAKAYLRSYNRDFKNTELLTYDDVLVRFKSIIISLEAATK